MLAVFLCEDDLWQRKNIEKIITDHIAHQDYEMELLLSADSPTSLLDYLENGPQENGLYILDVDLKHQINGIELAAAIREMDRHGKIVFVTIREELAYLTFHHRVEALDYIIKDQDDVAKRVQECIELAYRRYQEGVLEQPCFQVKTGGTVQKVPLDEIMFFEVHPGRSTKLILHTENGRIEFYASLSAVMEASPAFYRTHKSFAVNIKNVRQVNKIKGVVEMTNGECALVASRKVAGLIAAMTE